MLLLLPPLSVPLVVLVPPGAPRLLERLHQASRERPCCLRSRQRIREPVPAQALAVAVEEWMIREIQLEASKAEMPFRR